MTWRATSSAARTCARVLCATWCASTRPFRAASVPRTSTKPWPSGAQMPRGMRRRSRSWRRESVVCFASSSGSGSSTRWWSCPTPSSGFSWGRPLRRTSSVECSGGTLRMRRRRRPSSLKSL
uniref:Uncharacterized protein n=1 Tax=Ixodes ricinus TaxID=34613 RepID=A0A6B0UNL9_IXORI